MRPVRIHTEADAEADAAFSRYWYESQSAALGFDKELRIAIQTLRRNPGMGAPYMHGTRRMLLNRYPYFVVFRELPRKIQIVAIAHAKRRPGYWANRLKQ
ncbi:MAG TPA: type II toxin-antitoxin system RelE/ParE family toxin [Terracidiphilus sp.]|jgi:plasmid stabilization system protein ParE